MRTQASSCFRTILGPWIGCLYPLVPKQCSNNIFGRIGNKLIFPNGPANVLLCGVERDPNNPKKCQMNSNKYVIAETNEIYSGDKYDDIIPYSFKCPISGVRMVEGAYNPMNDAENNAYITLKMFKEWGLVDPWDETLKFNVHTNGNTRLDGRWYGDGRIALGKMPEYYHLASSLGVVAHEVAHAYTQKNSDLNYDYGSESGGLNEAFSDMAAVAAGYYASGCNNWVIGGDVKFEGPEKGLRYMKNPPKDGVSIDHADDFDNMPDKNVHYTSGVFNKAFYELATGPGWNVKKAFKVMAKANEEAWCSHTDWKEAAYGVLDAAKDLGYPLYAVVSAFSAVGINLAL